MSHDYETLSVEIDRGVLFATINNPPLHEVPQASRSLPPLVPRSPLEEVSQRAVDVSMREDVVGKGLHDVILVHIEDPLSAVPTRVPVGRHA